VDAPAEQKNDCHDKGLMAMWRKDLVFAQNRLCTFLFGPESSGIRHRTATAPQFICKVKVLRATSQ
jgi:hypothetical protein